MGENTEEKARAWNLEMARCKHSDDGPRSGVSASMTSHDHFCLQYSSSLHSFTPPPPSLGARPTHNPTLHQTSAPMHS
jgi:hypothetical protein